MSTRGQWAAFVRDRNRETRQKRRAQSASRHTRLSTAPATGHVEADGRIVLRVPRELPSPNVWNGRHWRFKHQLSQTWEKELQHATYHAADVRSFVSWLQVALLFQAAKKNGVSRRRVTITRETPSARSFIKDDDNLRFSVKPLLDALKRIGYIRNDSRKWLDLPTPAQKVSADSQHWTEIIIEGAS